VEKINDLLKNLWLASEASPFQFMDKIVLHDVMNEVLKNSRSALEARKITVKNEVPVSLPEMLVDRPKFLRLFELLLKDELVSLPAGSEIKFSARLAPESTPGRPEIELEIEDNGPGLPQEALRLLFDPFVARSDSPQEYGISLMACYFVVHHHGGKIEARSATPHGTIFRLVLPVDPNQMPNVDGSKELIQKMLGDDEIWQKWTAQE